MLRERRTRYGLTQAEVARAAGMRQPDLSAVETGRRRSPAVLRRVEEAIRSLLVPHRVIGDDGVRAEVRAVLDRYGARDVLIFGSAAEGKDRPGSDLDLMASFPPGFDLFDLMDVEAELEDLLGILVDVVARDDRAPFALAGVQASAKAL